MGTDWEGHSVTRPRARLTKPLVLVALGIVAGIIALPGGDEPTFTVEAEGPGPPPAAAETEPPAADWQPIDGGPLTARHLPTSVWAGRVAVVWSGVAADGGGEVLADGAAYDPRADSWEPLPPAPVSGRVRAAAAWTGDEVLVWGGTNSGGVLGDGAAYDPGARRWRRLPPAPLSPRFDAHGVWTNDVFVVWGGHRGDGVQLGDGAQYDPSDDRWRRLPRGPLAQRRDTDVSVAAVAEGIYIWSSSDAEARSVVYDTVRRRWRDARVPRLQPGSRPVFASLGGGVVAWGVAPRSDLSQAQKLTSYPEWWGDLPRPPVAPADGRRLVGEGTVGVSWSPSGAGLVLDLVAKTWTDLEVPVPRQGGLSTPTQLWAGDEMLVWHPSLPPGSAGRGATWSPPNRWATVSAPPVPLGSGTSAVWSGWLEGQQQMLVWGGIRGGVSNRGAAYHPDLGLWETMPEAPLTGRHGHAAAWTGEVMLIVGGYTTARDTFLQVPAGRPRRDGAAYDPAAREWSPLPHAPVPVTGQAAVWSGRRLYVAAQQRGRTVVAEYNPAELTWRLLPRPPMTRGAVPPTLVWSGSEVWAFGADPHERARGAAWDARREAWRRLPALPDLSGPLTITWADRRMVVMDGHGTTVSLGRAFDGWLGHEDAPIRGHRIALEWTGRGLVAYSPVTGTTAVLDPRSFGWSTIPGPPLSGDGWADLLWTGRHLVTMAGGSAAVLQP